MKMLAGQTLLEGVQLSVDAIYDINAKSTNYVLYAILASTEGKITCFGEWVVVCIDGHIHALIQNCMSVDEI